MRKGESVISETAGSKKGKMREGERVTLSAIYDRPGICGLLRALHGLLELLQSNE